MKSAYYYDYYYSSFSYQQRFLLLALFTLLLSTTTTLASSLPLTTFTVIPIPAYPSVPTTDEDAKAACNVNGHVFAPGVFKCLTSASFVICNSGNEVQQFVAPGTSCVQGQPGKVKDYITGVPVTTTPQVYVQAGPEAGQKPEGETQTQTQTETETEGARGGAGITITPVTPPPSSKRDVSVQTGAV